MIKIERALLLLFASLFVGGVTAQTSGEQDLSSKDLAEIMASQIEQHKAGSGHKASSSPESKADSTNKPGRQFPPAKFGRPSADAVSPEQFEKVQTLVETILRNQVHDPAAVLEGLISEGSLALSPDDIYLVRLVIDMIAEAENKPLVNPAVINKPYLIDINNRYSSYIVYLHSSGETLIEFLDVNGDPWPIFDHSKTDAFDVRKGEEHMLWLTPTTIHRQTNFFVMLKDYSAPIQFELKYSNEMRHGLATFKIPKLSPISIVQAEKRDMHGSDTVDLENVGYQKNMYQLSASSVDGHAKLIDQDLDLKTLLFLGETGRFEPGSEASDEAKSLQVSDEQVAQVWFYKDKFIVRSRYRMYSYDRVLNASGDIKVYLCDSLNSMVPFFDGQSDHVLFLPNYHDYIPLVDVFNG